MNTGYAITCTFIGGAVAAAVFAKRSRDAGAAAGFILVGGILAVIGTVIGIATATAG